MRYRLLLLTTLGFISGICVASLLPFHWQLYALGAVVTITALCVTYKQLPFQLVLLGLLLGALRYAAFFPPGWNILTEAGPAPVTLVGTIVTEPTVQRNKSSFVLRADAIENHACVNVSHAMVLVLVHGAAFENFTQMYEGALIKVSGLAQPIVPATNPGENDFHEYEEHHGVSGELIVQRPNGVTMLRSSTALNRWLDWASNSEQNLEAKFLVLLPSNESGLLFGIIFGDRHHLSPQFQREFAQTGTAHVLATAGLHVGILAIVLEFFIGLLPVPRKLGALSIITLLWMFATLVGSRPAVLRAVLAATIYFGARIVERKVDLLTTMAAAALCILTLQPLDLFNSDFQLSFVTVVGLALGMPYWQSFWEEKIDKVPSGLIRKITTALSELVGLSLLAQFFAGPLSLYYFSQVSLLSLPVNLLVVPLLFLLIPFAALALLLSPLSPSALMVISRYALHPILCLILQIVGYFAHLPFCAASMTPPPAPVIIVIYVAMLGILLKSRKRKQRPRTAPLNSGAAL